MPEWLKALLLAHGSLGYADTLATLVGGHPAYVQLPAQKVNGMEMGGGYFVDAQGNHTVGLTPSTIAEYGRKGTASYPGYKALDRNQLSGDRVLGHEFAHMARFAAGGNGALAGMLSNVMPDAYDERAADDFQLAAQFLRSCKTDMTRLPTRAQEITKILLSQPIYSEHALNKQNPLAYMIPKP